MNTNERTTKQMAEAIRDYQCPKCNYEIEPSSKVHAKIDSTGCTHFGWRCVKCGCEFKTVHHDMSGLLTFTVDGKLHHVD